MTIEELKAEKKKLANLISAAIEKFHKDTGFVPDIIIYNHEIKNCVHGVVSIDPEVSIKLI